MYCAVLTLNGAQLANLSAFFTGSVGNASGKKNFTFYISNMGRFIQTCVTAPLVHATGVIILGPGHSRGRRSRRFNHAGYHASLFLMYAIKICAV